MTTPRKLLPLFVDVSGRGVVVVGGGTVAGRKAAELAEAGARVRVVAPEASEEVAALAARGEIAWERRAYADGDASGAWLVFAATDDAEVQRRVADEAERARVFCVAVDDPPNASAYGAALIRRGALTVAISTSGEAPALARLLREVLEEVLPEESWVDAARALREKWKAEKTPMASRFGELVEAFAARARSS